MPVCLFVVRDSPTTCLVLPSPNFLHTTRRNVCHVQMLDATENAAMSSSAQTFFSEPEEREEVPPAL